MRKLFDEELLCANKLTVFPFTFDVNVMKLF